jgi:hypothetical protein
MTEFLTTFIGLQNHTQRLILTKNNYLRIVFDKQINFYNNENYLN